MKENIIGREEQMTLLENYIASNRSEFIAIYGRRRVGKTFLVKELFENNFTFRMTGKENASTKEQLDNFSDALSNFTPAMEKPKTWTQAFRQLSTYIEKEAEEGPKILFFDELPWFDTRGSKFVSALSISGTTGQPIATISSSLFAEAPPHGCSTRSSTPEVDCTIAPHTPC